MCLQVFMIFLPALRFLTAPRPPGDLAARRLAAVILPPLLFFAILSLLPQKRSPAPIKFNGLRLGTPCQWRMRP